MFYLSVTGAGTMKFLIVFALFILSGQLFARNDKLDIPSEYAPVNPARLLLDPQTGEQFAADMVLVAFKPHADRRSQESALARIDGQVIGGMPSLDIYQVSFNNPDGSIDNYQNIRNQLARDSNILFVLPRKVAASAQKKRESADIDDAIISVSRRGSLSLTSTERGLQQRQNQSVQDIIASHSKGLSACLERSKRIGTIHGTILFRVTISANGSVHEARVVTSTKKDRYILSCMLNKIRKWKNFPKHNGENIYQVDFNFDF
jgi:hypothetical protein